MTINNQYLSNMPQSSSAASTNRTNGADSSAPSDTSEDESLIGNAQPIANVQRNDESWHQSLSRHGTNLALAATRNVASVAVPTYLRELSRRTIFQQMAQASTALGVAGAVVAGGVLPIGLQIAGLVRDNRNGTQTMLSVGSRVAQIMVTGGTLVALFATGGAPALAAAAPGLMAANLVYTPLRDAVQYNLRLGSNANSSRERPMSTGATAIAAGAYVPNQIAVGYAMDRLSDALTPSTTAGGNSSTALSTSEQPSTAFSTSEQPSTAFSTSEQPSTAFSTSEQPLTTSFATTNKPPESWNESLAKGHGNSLGRATVNHVGETVDDIVSRYTQAGLNGTKDGNPITFSLDLRPAGERSWNAVANHVSDYHASRSNLFASAFNTAYMVDALGGNEHVVNGAVGAVLGTLYPTFVMSSSRPPAPDDREAAREARNTTGVPNTHPLNVFEVEDTREDSRREARNTTGVPNTHPLNVFEEEDTIGSRRQSLLTTEGTEGIEMQRIGSTRVRRERASSEESFATARTSSSKKS
jgi:hypothetical protein